MKKLLVSSVIAVSSLFAITACANVGAATDTNAYQTMPMQNQNWSQSPISQLDLTATQRAQIQAIRQNNRGNRMQNHDAIMQVLTAEQRSQLTELQNQRRALRQEQGGRMMKQGHHMNQGQRMHQGQHMRQGRPMNMNRGHHMNQGQRMNQNKPMNQGQRMSQ